MSQAENNKEVYSNRVLVLTKEGVHRENISKNLKKMNPHIFTNDLFKKQLSSTLVRQLPKN